MHWALEKYSDLCPSMSQGDRTLKNGSSIGSAAEGDGFEASIMAAITALTQEV